MRNKRTIDFGKERTFLDGEDEMTLGSVAWYVEVLVSSNRKEAYIGSEFNTNKAERWYVETPGDERPLMRLRRSLVKFLYALDNAKAYLEAEGYRWDEKEYCYVLHQEN